MATEIPVTTTASDITTRSGSVNYDQVLPFILEKLFSVIQAAAVIVAGIFAIRYLKKYLKKAEITHENQRTALNLAEKVLTGFIIVITLTIALKIVGIDMSLLVSVAILGLSYGLQDIIKNYVAGILILFKAPFQIGDTIKIKGFSGKVEKIDFQATTLRTFDRRHITIYNSDVITQSIENFSKSPIRRIELDFMLGYGSDIQESMLSIDKILKNHPLILDKPSYKLIFKKFTETGTVFTLKAWAKMPANHLGIKSDLAVAIANSFDEQNMFIPYTRAQEMGEDYTLTPQRKSKIQAFKDYLNNLSAPSNMVAESPTQSPLEISITDEEEIE